MSIEKVHDCSVGLVEFTRELTYLFVFDSLILSKLICLMNRCILSVIILNSCRGVGVDKTISTKTN